MHTRTQGQVENVLNKPSHAVLLNGAVGAGKRTVAFYIAGELLGVQPEKSQYFLHKNFTKKGGISDVREVKSHLGKTTTGTAEIRRIVLLESIENLSIAAQNALLKTVEEPPKDTVIILTTSDSTKVLSTIRSRSRQIDILPLSKAQVEHILKEAGSEVGSQYLLTKGFAGRLFALLEDSESSDYIKHAKKYLAGSSFERLCGADKLSKDKQQVKELLDGLEVCLETMLRTVPTQKIAAMHRRLEVVADAKKQLRANVNTKLLLTSLALHV